VLGVESEPMRVKIKKKQRNRREKRVKSKLRFTLLRISEVKVVLPEKCEGHAVEGGGEIGTDQIVRTQAPDAVAAATATAVTAASIQASTESVPERGAVPA